MNSKLTVLVATDLQTAGERAVELGLALDGRMHVVHAHSLRGPSTSVGFDEFAARRLFEALRLRLQGSAHLGLMVFRRGEAAAAILSTAAQLGADLIVLGDARGRTASRVLAEAQMPVLFAAATLEHED